MVTVINSVIDRFSRVDSVWLAASSVRLQVYDYNQLSDYNYTECSVKNIAADAPIIRGEILMVMIQALRSLPVIRPLTQNWPIWLQETSSTNSMLFFVFVRSGPKKWLVKMNEWNHCFPLVMSTLYPSIRANLASISSPG